MRTDVQKQRKAMQTTKSAHDILAQYMTERNMRKTPERFVVMDTLMQAEGHFSADQLLKMMPADFHVSRGTIYNTMSLLVDCGLAYEYHIGGATLYERAYRNHVHSHYICTGCNKMWDLRNEEIDKAVSCSKTPKFKKIRSSTYLYGLCNICQAKLARVKKKMEKDRLANMSREERRFARIGKELAEASEWFKQE